MIWQVQQVLSFGTSTQAVARTALQGQDLLNCFASASDKQRKDALHILVELQRKLLRCVEIFDIVDKAVTKAREDIASGALKIEPNARILRPPVILDLHSKAESFLQGAKLAIAQSTRLTVPFYGEDFGHQLHKFEKWAIAKFGEGHDLAKYAHGWQPMVKEIIRMRDAVDHPKSGLGNSLHLTNFSFDVYPEKVVLMEPKWWLEGEEPHSVRDGMAHYIEGIIQLQESLLSILFYEFQGAFPLVLYEIPLEERDPKCPYRIKVGLPPGTTFEENPKSGEW